MKAVEVIMEHGVPEDRIIFINLVRAVHSPYSILWVDRSRGTQVSAPEGLKRFTARYPSLKVVGQ
jgi:uracil phosphoribosyltransferase